jgi:hypothetical protein
MRKLIRAGLGAGLALFLLLGARTGASSGQVPEPTLHRSVPGCPVCELWDRYAEVFPLARQEVGSLRRGAIYYYYSNDPSVAEPLLRFAYERQELAARLATEPELRSKLGHACGHDLLGSGLVQLQLSTGAHGVFAIVTSDRESIIHRIHLEASQAVRAKTTVRF